MVKLKKGVCTLCNKKTLCESVEEVRNGKLVPSFICPSCFNKLRERIKNGEVKLERIG